MKHILPLVGLSIIHIFSELTKKLNPVKPDGNQSALESTFCLFWLKTAFFDHTFFLQLLDIANTHLTTRDYSFDDTVPHLSIDTAYQIPGWMWPVELG